MTKTLTTKQLIAIASGEFDACSVLDASVSMARELLANREAQPVAVTDEMALAFHRALNDGGIGESDLEEIKVGLRGALCNITAPPAPAVPGKIGIQEAKELFNYLMTEEELNATVNGYNACRAAMLAQSVSQGYKLVPVEPTEEMIAAAMNCDDVEFNSDETFCVNFDNIYRAMLAAAPVGGN